MRGHLLSDLQPSPIFEISRDACGAKGVAPNLGLDSGRERSPPNHPPHIGLEKGIAGQLAGAAAGGAEERTFAILDNAGTRDVLLEITVEIVVRGHLVFLAALLMKPNPTAPALHKIVLDLCRYSLTCRNVLDGDPKYSFTCRKGLFLNL
jgi:hypothetical protein